MRKVSFVLSRMLAYALLSLVSFVSVFPFFWMLSGATNSSTDIVQGKLSFGTALMANIAAFLASFDVPRVLLNSVLIAVLGTLGTLVVSSIAGYSFEIFRSHFKERLFSGILMMMSIPFAAIMVPLFVMMANLKLINTYQAALLPTIASIFIMFYFRQATKAFPRELRDAARVDGLSEWQIFIHVYWPVMRSTYAAATIIVFMTNWNNYLWPLIVLQTNEMKTLPLAISTLTTGYAPDFGVIMIAAIVATLPTLAIFFILQRRFVEGMVGAVK